ncbi:MAG: hypothetical protein WC926_00550 [Candidatus Paceibacterota bacterium]|jgi:hypothetical protein
MNTIEFLTALLSIETIVLLYHLTDGRTRNPRRMSEMMEDIFTLKNGVKVLAYFYAEYEMTVLEAHPEKDLGGIPTMALDLVLRRKRNSKKLDKRKIGDEASLEAKKLEKKINPKQDVVGSIKIVVETIRRATQKDLEEHKRP